MLCLYLSSPYYTVLWYCRFGIEAIEPCWINLTQVMEPTNGLLLNGGFDTDQMLSVWDITMSYINFDKNGHDHLECCPLLF